MARSPNECNVARFMPGRQPRMVNGRLDDRIFFPGVRYSSHAAKTATEIVAGIGFGPGQHLPHEAAGLGFKMSPGGLVIPVRPNDKYETVPVRDFSFVPEGSTKKVTKHYIDLTTFRQIAPGIIRAMPYDTEGEVYYEVWSGHPEGATEETKQLIQANMFHSGSVAFSGGTSVLDAASAELVSSEDAVRVGDIGGTNVSDSKATLMAERVGDVLGGVWVWTSRLWRVRFSPKDSESVLVRHLGKFWMLMASPTQGHVVHELPETAIPTFRRRFERLTLEQPVKPIEIGQDQVLVA